MFKQLLQDLRDMTHAKLVKVENEQTDYNDASAVLKTTWAYESWLLGITFRRAFWLAFGNLIGYHPDVL